MYFALKIVVETSDKEQEIKPDSPPPQKKKKLVAK